MRPPADLDSPYWFDKTQALCMVQHNLLAPFHGGGSYIGTDPARWLSASEPYEVRTPRRLNASLQGQPT